MTTTINTPARGCLTGDLAGRGEQSDHNPSNLPRRRAHDTATLARAAAHGDQPAWSILVRRYSATIRAVARRHRLSKADQDDVAQRTWLVCFQQIEHVREPAALAAWLTTIARHESVRALAASQREILTEEPISADHTDSTSLDETVTLNERRAALHTAVDALPAHERELIRTLLARPACTYDEISTALGIPRGSIGPTRGRSLARLRRDAHLGRAIGHARPERGLPHTDLGEKRCSNGPRKSSNAAWTHTPGAVTA